MDKSYLSTAPSLGEWITVSCKYLLWVLGSSFIAVVLGYLSSAGFPIPHWLYWLVGALGFPIAFYRGWRDERLARNKIIGEKRALAGRWLSEIDRYDDHGIMDITILDKIDWTFTATFNSKEYEHQGRIEYDPPNLQFTSKTERINKLERHKQTTMVGHCMLWDNDTLIAICDRTDGKDGLKTDYKEIRLYKRL